MNTDLVRWGIALLGMIAALSVAIPAVMWWINDTRREARLRECSPLRRATDAELADLVRLFERGECDAVHYDAETDRLVPILKT